MRPSSPRSYSSRANRYSRAYTTVSIIMYTFPVFRWSSTISRICSFVVAIGTVQATCLPAFSAAMLCGPWSGIGLLMWTASMSGSLSSSS